MGKIEIYGVIASPFFRIVTVVCESIGLPYEIKILDPINKSEEFKKLNPQQTVPFIIDDGFVLQESHAIVRYLIDKYAENDSLYPKDLKSRAVIHARLDFGSGTLLPRLRAVLRPVLMSGGHTIPEEGVKTINDNISIVEEFLTRNKWIAGPTMTIADISFATFLLLSFLPEFQIDLSQFPKTNNWLQEMKKNQILSKINEEGIASWRARYNFPKKN